MNRRRIVYPLLVAGLALGVGFLEGRWHSDRTDAAKRTLARTSRPTPPPTGVEVPMTIGPTPAGMAEAMPPASPLPPAPPIPPPASAVPPAAAGTGR